MSDETKTAPDEMTWRTDVCERSAFAADDVIAWVNANGGEARYESQNKTGLFHSRIVITGPSGPVYVAPGDTVVMGDDGFVVVQDGRDRLLREFTVRPAPGVSR